MWPRWLAIACFICVAVANVEKTIFVAPPVTPVPQDASIDNLMLLSLNPTHLSVRTHLNASFPSESEHKGKQTWALLEGLNPGQRYELRVCWLATQPTEFWIYTHTIQEAFEDPALISSLSAYAYARHETLSKEDMQALQSRRWKDVNSAQRSMLFLQIYAAADYFTLNQSLMENVPAVHVDLILDPYLMNIFPQSLGMTAVYIVVVAIGGWFIASKISKWLSTLVSRDTIPEAKKSK